MSYIEQQEDGGDKQKKTKKNRKLKSLHGEQLVQTECDLCRMENAFQKHTVEPHQAI